MRPIAQTRAAASAIKSYLFSLAAKPNDQLKSSKQMRLQWKVYIDNDAFHMNFYFNHLKRWYFVSRNKSECTKPIIGKKLM